jgi:hypothetical protein
MACSNSAFESSGCQLRVDTDLNDSSHLEPEDPSPRLCIWPHCPTLVTTLRELESHAVVRHKCLPPKRITKSWCEQPCLFNVSQYSDGHFTSLFGRRCL